MSGRVGDDPATALREHLIDAAERLIAQTPVTAITTRDIARAAGVSDGVLYNYFRDKNDLLVAALLRQYRSLIERFTRQIPEPGAATIEESLGALARALFGLAGDIVPMIAGLLSDPILFHRLFAALHEEAFGPQQLRQPLIAYLEEEQRLGRLPADMDREAVVLLLMGPTSMLALATHLAPAAGGPAAEPEGGAAAPPARPAAAAPGARTAVAAPNVVPDAVRRAADGVQPLVDALIRGLRIEA